MMVFDSDRKGTPDQLEHFTEALSVIRRRHLDTVPRMAAAVFKMTKVNSSEGVNETVQYFLDRLYINRQGERKLFKLVEYNVIFQDFYSHVDITTQRFAWK